MCSNLRLLSLSYKNIEKCFSHLPIVRRHTAHFLFSFFGSVALCRNHPSTEWTEVLPSCSQRGARALLTFHLELNRSLKTPQGSSAQSAPSAAMCPIAGGVALLPPPPAVVALHSPFSKRMGFYLICPYNRCERTPGCLGHAGRERDRGGRGRLSNVRG